MKIYSQERSPIENSIFTNSEENISERKISRTALLYGSVFMLTMLFILIRLNTPELLGNFDSTELIRVVLGGLNISILSALFIIYVLAYKLYKDVFYYFIGLNWLIIGINLIIQFAFLHSKAEPNEYYYFSVNALSVVSNVFLYLAISTPQNSSIDLIRFGKSFSVWIIATLFFLIISRYLVGLTLGVAFLIAQTPLSMWTLFRIGKKIKKRLKFQTPTRTISHLSMSFYFFGLLQLAYLISILIRQLNAESFPYIVIVLGVFSVLIKSQNLIGILVSLSHKYNEPFLQRSVYEELGFLAASLEHDIRNPLGIINAELHTMKNHYSENADLINHVNSLKEQSSRIHEATEMVVALRCDAESYQRLLEKIKVVDVIDSAVKEVKKDYNISSEITFSVRTSDSVYAKLYSLSFKRAICNVLKNSVEAIRKANRLKGEIDIVIGYSNQTPRKILIKITDNGIGIPSKEIPQMTSIQYTTKRESLNNGNGLFITDRIIAIHRGELEIESNIGEKTIVSILLPEPTI